MGVIAVLIGGFFVFGIAVKIFDRTVYDWIVGVCLGLEAVCFIGAVVSGICVAAKGATKDIDTKALQTRYQTLLMHKDDPYAIQEIVNWNTMITENKELSKSWWIGAFYPIDYDQFDIIGIKENNDD